MGKNFKGVYHLVQDKIIVYDHTKKGEIDHNEIIDGLDNPAFDKLVGEQDAKQFRESMAFIQGASDPFEVEKYLKGELTPVFFGSAIRS